MSFRRLRSSRVWSWLLAGAFVTCHNMAGKVKGEVDRYKEAPNPRAVLLYNNLLFQEPVQPHHSKNSLTTMRTDRAQWPKHLLWAPAFHTTTLGIEFQHEFWWGPTNRIQAIAAPETHLLLHGELLPSSDLPSFLLM